MRKMKRLLAAGLILCAVMPFAACGKKAATSATPGSTQNPQATQPTEKKLYQCQATIMITKKGEDPSYSSSDATVSPSALKAYDMILQSKAVQDKILEKYPNAEYTLVMAPGENTSVCTITATGSDAENLDELCDLAVSLLCEEAAKVISATTCKAVDKATTPKLLEAN